MQTTLLPTPDVTTQEQHVELVRLSFRNNGPGISEDIQEHIFEPFFTTKPVGQGLGLGLSMVYGFAHQSGGFVDVRSSPHKGTTIDLFLPKTESNTTQNIDTDTISQPAVLKTRLSALVVEDNDAFTDVTRKHLENMGFAVEDARDGGAAVEKLKHEGPFDFLLLDIVLPGEIDGVAVAKFSQDINPGAAFLFFTGFADDQPGLWDATDISGSVLRKPFSKEQLISHIKEALAKSVYQQHVGRLLM